MKEIRITQNNEDQKLIRYLGRILKNAPDGFLYKMLRKKNITLNGKKAGGDEILKKGDTVRIYFADETFRKFSGEEKETSYPPLPADRIVYEDENILIFNKPAGMLSQRSAGKELSACEYLIGYLQDKEETEISYRPSFVNRLDRNTTGLILGAKNLKAARELSEMIRNGSVKKEYLCLVRGQVSSGDDRTAFLTKDEKTNTVTVREEGNEEDRIETAYTPVKFCAKLNATVLLVDLKTGRTHQIRAHLASLNMPVAGDAKYGDQVYNEELFRKYGIRHQLLHSCRITFPKNNGTLKELSERSFYADPPFASLYE